MYDLIRRPGVFHASGQTISDAKAVFDLAQRQNAAIGGQQAPVEFGDNGLAGDR